MPIWKVIYRTIFTDLAKPISQSRRWGHRAVPSVDGFAEFHIEAVEPKR